MKKNRMMRLASILLVCVLLSTSVISGTFAKYVSEATGTSTATVAKWNVTVDDVKLDSTSKEFEFDLFKTILDTDPQDADADDEVAANLIAPGTKGSFDIVLKNDSEVDAEYAISFDVDDAGVPLKFKVNGEELEDIDFTRIDMGASATVKVEWEWTFYVDEAADKVDTELGLQQLVQPSVSATVTVQQVD